MSSREGRRVTARWNGTVVATGTATITVEGNHYFPPGEVRIRDHVAFWHGVTVSEDEGASLTAGPPAAPPPSASA